MNRSFDLRSSDDQRELAEYLPTIDGSVLDFSRDTFIHGLRLASGYLNNPSWLTYQRGMVGPIAYGNRKEPLELRRVVELGLELHDLSRYEKFSELLRGFGNPSQITDTMFEVQVASMFSRLTSTTNLRFAPIHVVRDKQKSPEFDVDSAVGELSVECKRPHMFVTRATTTVDAVADALLAAMKEIGWPREYRIEIEMHGPVREDLARFALRVVKSALASQQSRAIMAETAATVYVMHRDEEFRLKDVQFGRDRMVLKPGVATAALDPRFTVLRVVDNRLDRKFARSVGNRINEALHQLPDSRMGLIVVGDIPSRIVREVARRRIDDGVYDNILAIAAVNHEEYEFCFREPRRGVVETLFASGIRPLYHAA